MDHGLEESLRQSEERLRIAEERIRVIEGSLANHAVFYTDLQGRVTHWNAGSVSLFGHTEPEMIGKDFALLFTPEDRESGAPQQEMSQAVETGKGVDERWHLRKDGTKMFLSGVVTPVRDRAGEMVGYSKVARDITHRVQAEEAFRAAKDEAEAANRAKDQFIAILSHELRTPLNPILLATTAMLEQTTPPEDIRPNLEMIRQNVMLEARLIDDLLDVMRIVRGKMPLHWGVSDLHDLIHHAIVVCRSEIHGREVHLVLDLAAEHHHVNGDSARLQQCLWNLLKNAAKFTPGGGTVTIHTRNVDAADAELDRLVIEVADTGIGIKPDIMPTIFEPFQQGEKTIVRKYGGLGLGLAICKGVVEAHEGTLTVESPGKDQGATFRVELKTMPDPEGETKIGQDGVAPVVPSDPSPLTILVVEDEPATLRLMARLLRGLGHEVTTADTFAGALETERAGDFGLIISDIGLPDGSGLELMRRISARRGAVPAIALTGYGMEDDINRSREAGFTMHMTKPIDITKLGAMIRQIAPVVT